MHAWYLFSFPQKQNCRGKTSLSLCLSLPSSLRNYSKLCHITNGTSKSTAPKNRMPESDPPEVSCSFLPSCSVVGDKVRRFSDGDDTDGSGAIIGIPEAPTTGGVGLSLLPSVGNGFPSLSDPPDGDSSVVVGVDPEGPSVVMDTLGVPTETSAGAVLEGGGAFGADEACVGEDPLGDEAFEGGDPLGDESSGVGEDPLGEATGVLPFSVRSMLIPSIIDLNRDWLSPSTL